MDQHEQPFSKLKVLNSVVIVLAIFSFFLGSLVLFGWHSHNVTLIQLLPSFVPMQYNTALGFILCSLSFLAFIFNHLRLASFFAIGLLLLGGITLFEYIATVNIGIDQLFMEHYITTLSSNPGRMAPNTALCFILTSWAFIWPDYKSQNKAAAAKGILGATILGLGLIALFGYMISIETIYGWGQLTRMALHTSIGFMTIGIGLSLLSLKTALITSKMPNWISIPIGIFVLSITLSVWQALHPGQSERIINVGHNVLLAFGIMMSITVSLLIYAMKNSKRQAVDAEAAKDELYLAQLDLDFNHKVLEGLTRLQRELLFEHSPQQAFHAMLDFLLELTNSEYGFIGEIHQDKDKPYLKTHAISNIAWDDDSRAFYKENAPSGLEFTNLDSLFGKVITTGETVIANKPVLDSRSSGNIPQGHPPLKSFLGLPFHYAGKMIGMIGIANRAGGYDESLLKFMENVQLSCGSLLNSFHMNKLKEEVEDERRVNEKLNSVGLLAGGIAHDFNNILTILFGNISLTKSQLPDGHKGLETLSKAEDAFQRATHLTMQLLTFSKGGEPVKKNINLNKLIEGITRFDLSGSNVKLNLRADKNLWDINADEGQIEQVFNNLTINAIQAMPDGGQLHITAENIETKTEENKLERHVKIIIQDEGMGIKAENINQVFDPYFSTKEDGSGLGLATSYSIINKHNGHIDVASAPGTGTSFTISLPAAASNQSLNDKQKKETPEMKHFGKILMMDDEKMILNLAKTILESRGYLVETTENATQTISMYQQAVDKSQPFDCIILDLTVPGEKGGKDVIEDILKINPNAKAIVTSGYAVDPIMANHNEYGFKEVLPKPFTATTLCDVVYKAINESSN